VIKSSFLTGENSLRGYPDPLRRNRYYDEEKQRFFVFLTNNFSLPAQTIAELYKCLCQVELFFKWIKLHLCIQAFFGPSENAVKTQVWIAVSVYLLIAIMKKRLNVCIFRRYPTTDSGVIRPLILALSDQLVTG